MNLASCQDPEPEFLCNARRHTRLIVTALVSTLLVLMPVLVVGIESSPGLPGYSADFKRKTLTCVRYKSSLAPPASLMTFKLGSGDTSTLTV